MVCGRVCRFAGSFFCLWLLAGCALILPQTDALRMHRPPELPNRVELAEVPFFPQEENQCGPDALAMVLNAAGAAVTPEILAPEVYLPGRHGSLQVEMLAAARRHGMVGYELAPELNDVLAEVAAGTPVVVLQNYGVSFYSLWHYAVVVGYDLDDFEIILRSGLKPRLTMPFGVFEYLWKDGGRWAMVAVPPDRVPATATEARYAGAVVALEKGDRLDAASTAYASLLKRWPESLVGLMGSGNTAYRRGNLAAAETDFRRAAERHSESAAAWNNLAQTLADEGKLGEAASAARRAVSLGGPFQATSQATLDSIQVKQSRAE